MIGLSLFSGIYCNQDAIIKILTAYIPFKHVITDEQVIEQASVASGMPVEKLKRVFSSKTSIFNSFTNEKECSIAYLRQALFSLIDAGPFLISGYCSLLVPQKRVHVLRICLEDILEDRIQFARTIKSLSEKHLKDIINEKDADCAAWTQFLFSIEHPWNPDLYDQIIIHPISSTEKAVARIVECFRDFERTAVYDEAVMSDIKLSAAINVALSREGHNVQVDLQNGTCILVIAHQVLMLSRMEEELAGIIRSVRGAENLDIRLELTENSSTVYKKFNRELPSKLLLVDDEVEFVQTLSERLQMRDMGSVVALDGPSALELVRNDDPEVMIIDLKMPGMDGMDVLREVKKIRPEIEVIVLTGHGCERDRIQCMEMGAFDYMQKPVDINILSSSLRKAHKKIQAAY